MIDLHSHILHDIDDGARTLDMALLIARTALEDGITMMATTPHGRSAYSQRYSVALLRERLAELRAALAAANLPLTLVPGTELMCDAALPARLAAGELLTYGGSRAVLVEFLNHEQPATIEQMIFALQTAGYRVLVAHPERIKAVQSDPNILLPLVERGALTQLTADALTGVQGPALKQICETLLTHGLAHVIATDCHGPHFDRMPYLAAARRRAAELIGEQAAERLVRGTPAALLSDAPVEVTPPQRVQRKRWWW